MAEGLRRSFTPLRRPTTSYRAFPIRTLGTGDRAWTFWRGISECPGLRQAAGRSDGSFWHNSVGQHGSCVPKSALAKVALRITTARFVAAIYEEGGVLAEISGKAPRLVELTTPSAPSKEFFAVSSAKSRVSQCRCFLPGIPPPRAPGGRAFLVHHRIRQARTIDRKLAAMRVPTVIVDRNARSFTSTNPMARLSAPPSRSAFRT